MAQKEGGGGYYGRIIIFRSQTHDDDMKIRENTKVKDASTCTMTSEGSEFTKEKGSDDWLHGFDDRYYS